MSDRANGSTPAATPPGATSEPSNGPLTRHRLDDLERRMGTVEEKVDDLRNTSTRIETKIDGMKDLIESKLDGMADKSYVLRWFGLAAALLALTLVGMCSSAASGPGSPSQSQTEALPGSATTGARKSTEQSEWPRLCPVRLLDRDGRAVSAHGFRAASRATPGARAGR